VPSFILTPEDLAPFAVIDPVKAQAMIDDATALAVRVAPCIATEEFESVAAARAIVRGAILRWNEAGTGALQQQQVGPFGQTVDTRQQRRGMFWPSEIEQLQGLCATESPGAFALDMAPAAGTVHQPWCALAFGALYCSCGADIAGFPLYEA
jgi:hypothetical protein